MARWTPPIPAPRMEAPQRPAALPTKIVACPRCGRQDARVIGRSAAKAVVYLRCGSCRMLSVSGE